jgi:hypothetical protein
MAWKQNPDTGESYQVPDGPDTSPGAADPYHVGPPKKKKAANPGPPLPPGHSGVASAAPGAYVQPQLPALPPPAPTPVQPISLQGGQVSYNPTTAPHGMDMSAPGVQEQFWNQNQGMWFDSPSLDWVDQQLPQFQDPWYGEQWNQQNMGGIGAAGAGQQYWNGIQGQANTMTGAERAVSGGYKGPNNALSAFKQTNAALPGSLQPQFDAYYDRMKQKSMSDVNAQGASRGVYGSNASLNNSIGAGIDVEAQRAAAATKFSLDDSANQRNWFDTLGTQGRNADLSATDAFGQNIEASKFGLDKTKTMGDLAFKSEQMKFDKDKSMSDIAFGVDEAKANRLGAGISTAFGSDAAHRGQLDTAFDASGNAQDQREGRINSLESKLAGFSNEVQNFFSTNYDQLLGADGQIDDAKLEAMIARTADDRGYDQYQAERLKTEIYEAAELVIGAYTGGAAKKAGG